jgi:hypothetical protein
MCAPVKIFLRAKTVEFHSTAEQGDYWEQGNRCALLLTMPYCAIEWTLPGYFNLAMQFSAEVCIACAAAAGCSVPFKTAI